MRGLLRGNNKPDKRLPPRLFAQYRFPTGRLNIYSKPDILPFIQHVLRNTEELQYIKNSCFGKLFEFPAPPLNTHLPSTAHPSTTPLNTHPPSTTLPSTALHNTHGGGQSLGSRPRLPVPLEERN
ncbi:hypothetical protein HID58_017226 [Brassica napus]|uniref:Uncharacterized protein n=1 Tax=Brassica napus TaxID=3708 RepID=A0ABQ8D908_BRANA|nr:hypothetical protein HID58_017226 [Brassica napus]